MMNLQVKKHLVCEHDLVPLAIKDWGRKLIDNPDVTFIKGGSKFINTVCKVCDVEIGGKGHYFFDGGDEEEAVELCCRKCTGGFTYCMDAPTRRDLLVAIASVRDSYSTHATNLASHPTPMLQQKTGTSAK